MGGVITHEDSRRKLVEYIQDVPTRTAKVIYIKEDCELGNHSHPVCEDIFYLLKGSGAIILDGIEKPFKRGEVVHVKANVMHTLRMKKGSIILESSTLPYEA